MACLVPDRDRVIPWLTPNPVWSVVHVKKVSKNDVKSRSIADTATKLIGSTEPVSEHQRKAHFSGGREDRTRRGQ